MYLFTFFLFLFYSFKNKRVCTFDCDHQSENLSCVKHTLTFLDDFSQRFSTHRQNFYNKMSKKEKERDNQFKKFMETLMFLTVMMMMILLYRGSLYVFLFRIYFCYKKKNNQYPTPYEQQSYAVSQKNETYLS